MDANLRRWLPLCALAAVLALLAVFWTQTRLLLQLLTGASVLAFLLCPLSEWFARTLRLGRTPCILLSYGALCLALLLALWLLIPPLARQLRQLLLGLPALAQHMKAEGQRLISFLEARGLRLPLSAEAFPWEQALDTLSPLLGSTASFAGSMASLVTQGTLALALSFYFLRDRERLCLQLELLVPAAHRRTAVRMAHAVRHELSAYLRGQALISLAVGALAALGLMVLGVPAFLVLGLVVGVLNMIPYFGPVLGGIPAVLMALTQGGARGGLCTALLLLGIQQLDNLLISPRIMGSVTGLHPAVVLVAITLGGSLGGLPGMLFAIPCVLIGRALLLRAVPGSTDCRRTVHAPEGHRLEPSGASEVEN